MRVTTSRLLRTLLFTPIAVVAGPNAANGQEPPIVTPPPAASAAAEPPPAPMRQPPTYTMPLDPVSPPAPPTAPTSMPSIHVGAWVRAAARYYFANDTNASAVDSGAGMFGQLRATGNLHKNVSFTLGLAALGQNAAVGVMDAVIGFDFADPIHLWLGQLLVPFDRANLGGPFFAIPWNFYPGILAYGGSTQVVAIPRQNPLGRDGGAVLWGDLADKKLHYALGVFLPSATLPGPAAPNAPPVAQTPLPSGRISVDILGQEGGYFGNSTYFGGQDVVSVGIGGQFQKDGSIGATPAAASQNYAEFNSDLLVEMRYGGGGFITLDGAYYHYVGNNEPIQDQVSILAAIATPRVGAGNIQPYGRWQWFSPRRNSPDLKTFAVDAGLNYLIMGPALRIMLAFEHVDLGNSQISNVVQLGAQAIIF